MVMLLVILILLPTVIILWRKILVKEVLIHLTIEERCLIISPPTLPSTPLPTSTPPRLWLPVTGGGWSAAGYLCSVLCSMRGPGGVLENFFLSIATEIC